MISQTVEYALRAVVTIAQHGGAPLTAQRISELTKVPAPYLSKMLQSLVRANLLGSQRGINGGFTLNRSPEELRILEVVNVVDPVRRIHTCPLGFSSHGTNLCPLHRRLDDAIASLEEVFRKSTVAEMLTQKNLPTPLCDDRKAVTNIGD